MIASLALETIYTFVVVFCCYVIAKHTRCLFQLSGHKGIQYFQYAFAAWGAGFLFRYLIVLGTINTTLYGASTKFALITLSILFEYLISLGGFFLVYSLIWKQMQVTSNSIVEAKYHALALHALALAVALADVAIGTYHFLFIVQIIVLGYSALLNYDHWKAVPDKSIKHTFASLYVVALLLALVGYIINYLIQIFSANYPQLIYLSYLLTASIFIIMLYGVMRIMHSSAYCEHCCCSKPKQKNQSQKNGKKTRKA